MAASTYVCVCTRAHARVCVEQKMSPMEQKQDEEEIKEIKCRTLTFVTDT